MLCVIDSGFKLIGRKLKNKVETIKIMRVKTISISPRESDMTVVVVVLILILIKKNYKLEVMEIN